MNTLDVIFCVLVALLGLRCLIKGIVYELMTKAAFIGSILAALLLHKFAGSLILKLVDIGAFAPVAGFAAVALIVFVIIKLLHSSISAIVEGLHIQAVDKGLGLLLGLVEGILAASLILVGLKYQPVFDVSVLLDGSVFAKVLLPLIAQNLPAVGA